MIQARVTTGGKISAMIMAEDKATGLLLRADIIIDRMRVLTKTHQLYLAGGNPGDVLGGSLR